ncbi:MAG: hypothetical protein SGPRY_010361, partial [Prymnesium sp.]
VASGLYEDQVDKIDWCAQHIGRVTHSLFHSSGPHRTALVATELGVIAGVDLRQSTLAWRQVLPTDEKVVDLQQSGKVLVSLGVAPAGLFIRLWSTLGSLVWDHLVPGPSDSSTPIVQFVGKMIVVAWKSDVIAFDGTNGAQVWCVQLIDKKYLCRLAR